VKSAGCWVLGAGCSCSVPGALVWCTGAGSRFCVRVHSGRARSSVEHSAPGTEHQHRAPSTQHQAKWHWRDGRCTSLPGARCPDPPIEHEALSTQHQAPAPSTSTKHRAPAPSTQHPAPSTRIKILVMFSPGVRVGPYTILGQLGSGGMGEVYRACDPRLDRDVAIKVLPAAFAADASRIARFEQEARTIAALSHSNVLAVFDTGLTDAGAESARYSTSLPSCWKERRFAGDSRQGRCPSGRPSRSECRSLEVSPLRTRRARCIAT
jgi:hypothetical protein